MSPKEEKPNEKPHTIQILIHVSSRIFLPMKIQNTSSFFLLQFQLIIQKFTYHNFESCATKKNSIDLFHWEQSTNCSHTPNSIHQKAKQSVPCRAIEATNEKKRKTDWQCTHKTDTTDVFHSKFKERIARKTATQDV